MDFETKNNNEKFVLSGYELVHFCELDKYATQSYCAVHGVDESKNLGDITKVDENALQPFTMICGGSPCFPAGTQISMMYSKKPIEEIEVGDYVITHNKRAMKVVKSGMTGHKHVYRLESALGNMVVYATPNHKFLKYTPSGNIWVQLSELKVGDELIAYSDDMRTFARIMIGKISQPIKNAVPVYDLTVEGDHSFVANGFVVHNCQDFSIAGRQEGVKWVCQDCGEEYNPLTVHHSKRDCCPKCGSKNIDKTRSSLLVEWLRIIKANKPVWGIYENVKNIVGKRFKDAFDMFIEELHEYGYNTYWKVLNSKDYGIPQNRERLYLIIILKEYDNGLFEFPEPFDNGIRLKDMLEDEVDEKYYVNNDKATALISKLVYEGKIPDDVAPTIRRGGNVV